MKGPFPLHGASLLVNGHITELNFKSFDQPQALLNNQYCHGKSPGPRFFFHVSGESFFSSRSSFQVLQDQMDLDPENVTWRIIPVGKWLVTTPFNL